MSKKSFSYVVVLLVIASLALAACLPGTAFAAGGNGNGVPQAGSGGQVQNQNCTANCSGTPAQTGSSYGPGPAAQTGLSYGPGAPAQAGSGYANGGAGRGAQSGPANRRGPGAQAGGGLALGPLSAAESSALQQALQEEYAAQALYQHVLDQFGSVAPFSYIVQAETQHLNALMNMATKYGVTVPTFNAGNPTQFGSLAEACQAGVAAEQADAALYDTLTPVTLHADLLQVYHNLQAASLNQHLPAFQACD